MNNEFDTVCEDGSLEEVGETLCRFHRAINDGKQEEVRNELRNFKGSGALHSTTLKTDRTSVAAATDPNEDDSPKQSKNEPDEDGWITVSKGKK